MLLGLLMLGRRGVSLGLLGLSIACAQAEPPGVRAEPDQASEPVLIGVEPAEDSKPDAEAEPAQQPSQEILGTAMDNLPFQPTGKRLASIAWRTWIYTDTGAKRTRLGYLRAGAVVDVREPSLGANSGCEGGWYRINPRGFVCVGKGATLEVENNPVVVASDVRPIRGQGFPYGYAMAGEVPPFLYFKLPEMEQMVRSEGEGVAGRAAAWKHTSKLNGVAELLGELGAPPSFLGNGASLVKPYGVEQPLRYAAHAGKAKPDGGFALARTFEHEGRAFGLTTELDIIPLDRVKVVKPSSFRGIAIDASEDLPVAFIERHYVQRYLREETGRFKQDGSFSLRDGVKLTGKKHGTGGHSFYETVDGSWMSSEGARIIEPRAEFPSFAHGARKWLDLSISQQVMVAYEGTQPVYATLVSTGRGGLGDPEKVPATVLGTFMVHTKHISATMNSSTDKSDGYSLQDVPFVQYFHKGYALHGTYWHDDFGKVRSQGCVNLSPIDSAWFFEWTDPPVPEGWHGVLNLERGTVVHVRP